MLIKTDNIYFYEEQVQDEITCLNSDIASFSLYTTM